jgi:small multidrug resistance pump
MQASGAACPERGAAPVSRQNEATLMSHWLLLALAIGAEVIGTSFLKAAEGFTKPGPSIVVLVCYAAAFYFLSLTLRTLPVGIAYAIWSGVGVVLIALVGWLVFGQSLDLAAIIGMALIVAGVIVLNAFSSTLSH